MLELKAKLKIKRGAYNVQVRDRLEGAFAERNRRGTVRLASGEEAELKVAANEVVRGGDLLTASDGRVIEVVATPEKLLHIEGPRLAHLAWLLGNGHVPLQFGDTWLRMAEAPGIDEALAHFGVQVRRVEEPFEPEVMAHGHDHDHDHDHHHDHGHDHHRH